MDFKRYAQWQDVFQIDPLTPNQAPADLRKGDRLRVHMRGMTFHPNVVGNTPDAFTWDGVIPVIIYGTHYFVWAPSEETPGATTFAQKEDFQGLLAVAFWPWRGTVKPSKPWESFNASIKREAERVAALEGVLVTKA